jgi:hypothetical protein
MQKSLVSGISLMLVLFLASCSEVTQPLQPAPPSSNTQGFTLSGKIENWSKANTAQIRLFSCWNISFISDNGCNTYVTTVTPGQINLSGSFSIQFPDSSGAKPYLTPAIVAFDRTYCQNVSVLPKDVNVRTFIFGTIKYEFNFLESTQPPIENPIDFGPSSKSVVYAYSDKAAQITANCKYANYSPYPDSAENFDLNLIEGWNKIIISFDKTNTSSRKLNYSTEVPPGSVGWYAFGSLPFN